MLEYLLKSAVCMTVFLVFYQFLLEQEKMHQFKRFFLLGALIASLIIPALVFTEYIEAPSKAPIPTTVAYTSPELVAPNEPVTDMDVINWSLILWTIYSLGLLIFGLRFVKHLYQIIQRIRKNPKLRLNAITQVFIREKISPHTFFHYIFLNKEAMEQNNIPKEVLLHEETHSKQLHSLDVLFIELLQVILWFNPLLILFKKNIKLNHEFLADHAVLKENVPTQNYQNTLLSFLSAASANNYKSIKMANTIIYSSTRAERSRGIKKRFTVMKKRTSQKTMIAKSLLLLPLLVLLVSGFCERKTIYTNQNQSSIEGLWLDQPMEQLAFSIASDGKNQSFYQGYSEIPIVTINNRHFVKYPGTSIELVLNKEQNMLQFRGKEYIRFENSFRKKYEGQWKTTDGTIELDIENYTDAFICNLTLNGRTNKFYPSGAGSKGFGFSYGHEYWSFELKNEKLHDSKGNIYFKEKIPIKSDQKNYTSRKGLSQIEFQEYLDLSQKFENNKTGKNRVLFSEAKKILELQNRMSDEQKQKIANVFTALTTKAEFPQTSASREQMKEYNALAKKYNEMSRENMRVKIKEVERMKYIYGLMSDKQKADAEPFPEFPIPPEMPTFRSPPEVQEIQTPPKPPTPPSPLDHVIEMAKKGATFYYEGEEVSSDRAIELLKSDGSLNIQTTQKDSKNPKVRISKSPFRN